MVLGESFNHLEESKVSTFPHNTPIFFYKLCLEDLNITSEKWLRMWGIFFSSWVGKKFLSIRTMNIISNEGKSNKTFFPDPDTL